MYFLFHTARTYLANDSSINFHWCDYTFDCYGIYGVLPNSSIPDNTKVYIENIQVDPHAQYPGIAALDLRSNPGIIFC